MIVAIIWVGVAVFIFCIILIFSFFEGCHRKTVNELATITKMEDKTSSLLDSEPISITAFIEYMRVHENLAVNKIVSSKNLSFNVMPKDMQIHCTNVKKFKVMFTNANKSIS